MIHKLNIDGCRRRRGDPGRISSLYILLEIIPSCSLDTHIARDKCINNWANFYFLYNQFYRWGYKNDTQIQYWWLPAATGWSRPGSTPFSLRWRCWATLYCETRRHGLFGCGFWIRYHFCYIQEWVGFWSFQSWIFGFYYGARQCKEYIAIQFF